MCPFVVFGKSGAAEGTGTSRISINASRSPLRHPASYLSGSMEVVGGYGNTVLSGSALTPDGKTQYLGAVFAAMTPPTAKNSPVGKTIERWFHDGSPFTPIYPDQIDPGDPDATVPFPHRGGHAILLNPIFTGPLP